MVYLYYKSKQNSMFLKRNAAKYFCLKSLKNVTLQTRDGNIFLACRH